MPSDDVVEPAAVPRRGIIPHVRLGAAFSVAVALFTVRMCAAPLRWIAPRLELRIRRGLFSVCSRWVLWCTGIRLTIVGNRPRAPFVLVTNHTTYFDIFVLASQLGCVFVARGDIAQWPFIGLMVRGMNTIFIDRSSVRDAVRVNELVSRALDEGNGIVIFPEGGVSQENRVLPFKAALLETPARLGLPVHYAAIHYSTPPDTLPAADVAIWRDGVSFLQHYVDFASLRYVDARVTFGGEAVHAPDRRTLAAALHENVSAVHEPFD